MASAQGVLPQLKGEPTDPAQEEKSRKKDEIYNILLWYIVFIFGAPVILSRVFGFNILRYYLATVDIIANIFANADNGKHFGRLYVSTPTDIVSYISSNFLSLLALVAVSWNSIHYAFKLNSMWDGVLISIIMYTVTYLIPVQATVVFMKRYEDIAADIINNRPADAFLIGFILLIVLMIIENILVYMYFKFLRAGSGQL